MPAVVGGLILGAELAATVLIGTGATALTLGTVVGGVVLAGAAIGISALMAPKVGGQQQAGAPRSPTTARQALRQAMGVRITGYGRIRLAGYYMLYEVRENISYDVLAVHTGRIAAIVQRYLHDDVAVVAGDGTVHTGPDGRYGTSVKFLERLGLATETAYSEITGPLSDIWTSAHRGDGVASIALICQPTELEDFTEIYPKNELPKPSIVAECSPVWDFRTAQSRTSPSTWAVSFNPVVQILDFLCGASNGNQPLNGRYDFDYADIVGDNLDHWIAQADICDEPVTLKNGNDEPRYQSHLWWYHNTNPADTLQQLLSACDGWLVEDGDGLIWLWVGKYEEPTEDATITEADILGYSLSHDGMPDERVVNEITFVWTSPDLGYKEAPGQPLRDEADISSRGIERTEALDLTVVQSHSQGRRLVKRALDKSRAKRRGSLSCTLRVLELLKYRWLRIQYSGNDDLADIIVERGAARISILGDRVDLEWTEVDTLNIDRWRPERDEGDAPPMPALLEQAPLPFPTGLACETRSSVNSIVSFNDPYLGEFTGLPRNYKARYRASGALDWIETGYMGDAQAPGTDRRQVIVPSSTSGGHDEIQIATAGTGPGISQWSFLNLRTDATPPALGAFSAIESEGDVTLSWINPSVATNYYATRVWRNGIDNFAGASDVSGPLFGTASAAGGYVDDPGEGTWYYWVTSEHTGGGGVARNVAGPQSVTVTPPPPPEEP